MHHKRGRPKNRRSGCLICKPHKMNGYGHKFSFNGPSKVGGSNLKQEFLVNKDLIEYNRCIDE